jgi:hypothetical protein
VEWHGVEDDDDDDVEEGYVHLLLVASITLLFVYPVKLTDHTQSHRARRRRRLIARRNPPMPLAAGYGS